MIWMLAGAVAGALAGFGYGVLIPFLLSLAYPVEGSPLWILMFFTIPVAVVACIGLGAYVGAGVPNPALRTLLWKGAAFILAAGLVGFGTVAREVFGPTPLKVYTPDVRIHRIFEAAKKGPAALDQALANLPGETVDLADSKGMNAARIAVEKSDGRTLETILRRRGGPGQPEELEKACFYRWIEGVRILLEHGTDPNNENALSWAEVFIAWKPPTPEIFRLLMKHGARPHPILLEAPKGPLFEKRPAVLREFLASGSDLCVKDAGGKTSTDYLAELVAASPEGTSADSVFLREILEKSRSCPVFHPAPKWRNPSADSKPVERKERE
jgi:hypothetical protein